MIDINNPYTIGGIALSGAALLFSGGGDRVLIQDLQRSTVQAQVHAQVEGEKLAAENEVANARLRGQCARLPDGVTFNAAPDLVVPGVRPGISVCDTTGNTATIGGDGRPTALAQSHDPAVIQSWLDATIIYGGQ